LGTFSVYLVRVLRPTISAAKRYSSRRNVLDVDANAVPAQRIRRVDSGDGQLDQAQDRQEGDGERGLSARGCAQKQLRNAATIVHRGPPRGKSNGLLDRASGNGKGIVNFGLTRNNCARVDQGHDELHDRCRLEIEVLNVDLGRVYTRPSARDTTTVCVGLSTADDLHAVREDILGSSRSTELLEKLMR